MDQGNVSPHEVQGPPASESPGSQGEVQIPGPNPELYASDSLRPEDVYVLQTFQVILMFLLEFEIYRF